MKKLNFIKNCDALYVGKGMWIIDLDMYYIPIQQDEFIWCMEDLIVSHLMILYPQYIYRYIVLDDFPDVLYRVLMTLGTKVHIYMKCSGRRRWMLENRRYPWAKQGIRKMRATFRIGHERHDKYVKLLTIRASIDLILNKPNMS